MVRARLLLLACLACFAWGCAETQHPGDESSADDVPRHTKHRAKKKKKVAHKHHDEDEDAPKKKKSSDDDEDDAPKKKKLAAKKASDDDDDDAPKKKKPAAKRSDDDEDDAPKKPVKKVAAKESEDDDEDAPKKKPAPKVVAKKTSDDEDEDAPKKKPALKPVAKKNPHSELADEEEDSPKKPVKKVVAKKASNDEDEVAPKKPVAKAKHDDEPKITDDDEEEPAAKPKAIAVVAKPKVIAKAKPKVDDEEDKPKPKAKPKTDDEEDKPVAKKSEDRPAPEEPPKKQRSIEEDIAVDDPLATQPPPRAVASADEGGEEAGESATVTAAVAPPPPGSTLQDRSLTTPAGQLDLHAGLPIDVLTLKDAMGVSTSSTSTGLALGVAYGVNAKTEVGFDYTLGVSPGKLQGPATLHGAYSLAHGKLDFAAAAAAGIDFYDTVDSATMMTSTKTAASLQLGAWVRYHATPTVSIFSGLPATPNASASLSKLAFALPLVSYQIQIGLSDRGTSAITLPIGLGYQASPKLYTFASLNLANIRIANTANAFLFKDYIPIAIGGFYNFDMFSLGASFADDLKQGFGYLRFELVARYLLH